MLRRWRSVEDDEVDEREVWKAIRKLKGGKMEERFWVV